MRPKPKATIDPDMKNSVYVLFVQKKPYSKCYQFNKIKGS